MTLAQVDFENAERSAIKSYCDRGLSRPDTWFPGILSGDNVGPASLQTECVPFSVEAAGSIKYFYGVVNGVEWTNVINVLERWNNAVITPRLFIPEWI